MPLVPCPGQPFDDPGNHVQNCRIRLCLLRFLPLVLLTGGMGLVALALASPPNPVWILGFYDEADRAVLRAL